MAIGYSSDFTGKQMDASAKNIINPTHFTSKSNTDAPITQDIALAGTYQSVDLSSIPSVVGGDFEYDGLVLKYIGLEDAVFGVDMGCSVKTDTINTTIHMSQFKNGVVDYGVTNGIKIESNTGIAMIGFDTSFDVSTGDELDLRIKSDNLGGVHLYHFQTKINLIKIDI